MSIVVAVAGDTTQRRLGHLKPTSEEGKPSSPFWFQIQVWIPFTKLEAVRPTDA